MSEPDASFDRRLEQAKLEAMKELAYGASHEVNNPLANISARAQTLLRDESDPDRRRALEAINHQALRAHEMISDLMLFARPPQLQRDRFDLSPIIREIIGELSADSARRDIAVTFIAADNLPQINADRVQVAVAIKALLLNAIEAIGRDGLVECHATASGRVSEGAPSAVRITVTDSGPGIPPHIRPRIFDPFFSGREAGRGLGFGLSKAWRIVTDHGGQLTVESGEASGATFIIELPTRMPSE
jgi:signal transduction histidine kinase